MTASDQSLLLRALVDELARCGMRHAVTAPGSRNTPVIEALVREPRLQSHSVIDERSAGFFALGAAKASGRAVAITATSGTAVANLHPAVIEAHEAGVPLIVLSGDRPAELREVGAGQTIDQVKLFGSAVKWFFELDIQTADAARMRWIRSLACRAWMTAAEGRPGPVHLNIPLREPLLHAGELPADPDGGEGRPDGRPWVSPARPQYQAPALTSGGRLLIVAGEGAQTPPTGIPVLADPLSGLRSGPAAVAHYDLILRDAASREHLAPDMVWRLGGLPTSKPLRNWLAELRDVPQIHLGDGWIDPAAVVSAHGAAPIAARDPDVNWLAAWRAADAVVAEAIHAALGDELGEPQVARLLTTELPSEATLLVAASMPIRDVEEFAPVREQPPRILANRGANGIDGTVSTAFGVAAVSDGPVVLLIGDVALAHDIGGLLATRRGGPAITIVLINNDGGGIFNFLAVADHADIFEQHVATPHGLDFTHAAALYGLSHITPADMGGFKAALNSALHAEHSTLIEVRTDRAQNRALHKAVEAAAKQALSRPAPAAAPGA